MGPQLAAMFAAHKTAFLAAGAAGIAGLALLKKKNGSTTPTSTTTAGATVPVGTIPAGAVTSTGGTYDSSAYDAYNALQPELESILQTVGSSTATAPAPVSSPILSNTDWESQAVEGWAQTGGAPLDLMTALNQFAAGQPINTAQASGVNWAISKYGLPPQGTSGTSPIVKA